MTDALWYRAGRLAPILASCARRRMLARTDGDAHDVVVANQTTLAVTVAVNGTVVRTIQQERWRPFS